MLGIMSAWSMRKRVEQLRELERIINYLEGEISYRHSILSEACMNASLKCGQPFNIWLSNLSTNLESGDSDEGFEKIWSEALTILDTGSALKKEDIEVIKNMGHTLGYLDIRSQEMGLALEKENIHERAVRNARELSERMRVSVIMGTLGGILIVIMLL